MLKKTVEVEFMAIGHEACKELGDDLKRLKEKYDGMDAIEIVEHKSSTQFCNSHSSQKFNDLIDKALKMIGIK